MDRTRRNRRARCACTCMALSWLAVAASASASPSAFERVPAARIMHPFDNDALIDNMKVLQKRNTTSDERSQARYGHSAVCLPEKHQVLFIGGQIGTHGTYVTNDILSFNTSEGYNQTKNPKIMPDLSDKLVPNAWTATGTTDNGSVIWSIGGVTQDCQNDASAYTFNTSDPEAVWRAIEPAGSLRPPRRRQAKAISIYDKDKNVDKIYVFGGIAEPYTCSLETVAYLAMDIWRIPQDGTSLPQVEILPWKSSAAHAEDYDSDAFRPPVSDYTAVYLPDKQEIAYFGGQDAAGHLVQMDLVLLFDIRTQTFSVHKTDSTALPTPRMGHTSVLLEDGRILVHGGVGHGKATLKDSLYVLDPTQSPWTWDMLETTTEGPSLAYHSASLVHRDVLLVAYGLDTRTQETSDQLHFLARGQDGWTWSQQNPLASSASPVARGAQVGDALAGITDLPQTSGVLQAAQQLLTNSLVRMTEGNTAAKTEVGALPGGGDPNGNSVPLTSSHTSVYATSTSASISAAKTRDAEVNSALSPEGSDSSSPDTSSSSTGESKSQVIAGAVTGAFVLAVVAGMAGLYFRRKASASAKEADSSDNEKEETAPPVSEMLYTRQAPRRMLSLGSTASYKSGRTSGYIEKSASQEGRPGRDSAFMPLSESEALEAVDEFGRLSPLKPSGHRKRATLSDRPVIEHMVSSSSLASEDSRASVAEYPFLTSVPILALQSQDASRPTSQISQNQTVLQTDLGRSHSLITSSSKYSHDSDARSPGRLTSLRYAERDVASTPLPSREFGGPEEAMDPFADPAMDGMPSVSDAPMRIRDPESIPSMLRPNTPRRH